MRFDDLPKQYKDRIIKNQNRASQWERDDHSTSFGFQWTGSPEGGKFWAKVYNARTIQELPLLPPLPEKEDPSLVELGDCFETAIESMLRLTVKLQDNGFYDTSSQTKEVLGDLLTARYLLLK